MKHGFCRPHKVPEQARPRSPFRAILFKIKE